MTKHRGVNPVWPHVSPNRFDWWLEPLIHNYSALPFLGCEATWNIHGLSAFHSLNFALWPVRWRWWGREWRRAPSFLLRLHHALPYGLLESPVRLRAAHWVLERLGVFHRIDLFDWDLNSRDGWPGLPLWLYHRPEGLRYRRGVRSAGHLSTRSVNEWMSHTEETNV